MEGTTCVNCGQLLTQAKHHEKLGINRKLKRREETAAGVLRDKLQIDVTPQKPGSPSSKFLCVACATILARIDTASDQVSSASQQWSGATAAHSYVAQKRKVTPVTPNKPSLRTPPVTPRLRKKIKHSPPTPRSTFSTKGKDTSKSVSYYCED